MHRRLITVDVCTMSAQFTVFRCQRTVKMPEKWFLFNGTGRKYTVHTPEMSRAGRKEMRYTAELIDERCQSANALLSQIDSKPDQTANNNRETDRER